MGKDGGDRPMDTTCTTTGPKSPMDRVHTERAFLPPTGRSSAFVPLLTRPLASKNPSAQPGTLCLGGWNLLFFHDARIFLWDGRKIEGKGGLP